MSDDEPRAPGGAEGAQQQSPQDLLLAVLGVQLGYCSPDEALACAREVAEPGESRTLKEFLLSRGVVDEARAQALERLTATASAAAGDDMQRSLELLASSGARSSRSRGP